MIFLADEIYSVVGGWIGLFGGGNFGLFRHENGPHCELPGMEKQFER